MSSSTDSRNLSYASHGSLAAPLPSLPFSTLVDLVRHRALHQPDLAAYSFLLNGETDADDLSYAELDRQARSIGAALHAAEATGGRALLLYPPGLAYIAAFFGCLYAGVVAVPAYPPTSARPDRVLAQRLRAIVRDARPTVALLPAALLPIGEALAAQEDAFKAIRWLATDTLPDAADAWRAPAVTSETLALLQYTSGSTAAPKGVMLTHSNLLHNLALIQDAFGHSSQSRGVIWLPPYHDMGLIGGILQPLYSAFPVTLMAPTAFLQRPLRWLEAISRLGATTSGGPNFAYDLCVRKTTPEQRAALDLSTWEIAFSGAEPVRAATLERFAQAFAVSGFRREALYPCYGLAEATLIVSGGRKLTPPRTQPFDRAALEQHQAVPVADSQPEAHTLVSCGQTLGAQQIVIVEPEQQRGCAPDQVGEIWVAGPSVAQGYWDRASETAQTFGARLVDSTAGPFLRTGDLGVLVDGELFVTGRLKDLLILRGRNHYPQDIEQTVERSHPALQPGGAAFAVEADDGERLVVVQEVARQHRHADLGLVTQAIRQAVAEQHAVAVAAVVLVKPGGVPRTTSGKIQRQACRAGYLAGELDELARDVLEGSLNEPEDQLADQPIELTRAMLLALPMTARPASLTTYLQAQVARSLGVARAAIDPAQPLSGLGLDSLMAVEVQHAIELDLGAVVPMATLLQGATITEIAAQVLEQIKATETHPEDDPLAAADALAGQRPLSFAQERLWLLEQLAEDAAVYTIPAAVRLRGKLDTGLLQHSVSEIVRRHETLRTTFTQELPASDGQPVQVIAPAQAAHMLVDLPLIDMRGVPLAGREAAVLHQASVAIAQPFDLQRGPLLHMTLLQLAPDEHVLIVVMHHIVADGWSMTIFVRELAVLYGAAVQQRAADLPALSIQYADVAAWQRAWLQGERLERQRAYWRAQLGGDRAPTTLDLPTDRSRPAVQTFRGGRVLRTLSPPLTDALRARSRRAEATLFMTLLTAFNVLLQRYSGQDDIVVGTPIAGRTRASSEALIGVFVNTLVLRTDLSAAPSFHTLLARVRRTALDAYAHQELPFEQLLEELQPARDLSRTPLFQVLFNMLNLPAHHFDLPGLRIEPIMLPEVSAKFDLTLYVQEQAAQITFDLVYNAELFDAARMAELLAQLEHVLTQIVDTSGAEQPITRLSLVTPAATALLPDPTVPLKRSWNQSLQARYAAQASRVPTRIAVEDAGGTWTYAELDKWSNRIANALLVQGIEPQAPVAIYAQRSAALVAALLGVLKAGAAFVILDPAYPPARLCAMLEIAQPRALLQLAAAGPLPEQVAACAALTSRWSLVLTGRALAELDELRAYPPFDPEVAVAPDDLAYITFTSGSTGQPKAILGTQRPLTHFLDWHSQTFALDETDRFSLLSGLSHDPALRDIFTPLWLGATLCIPAQDQTDRPGGLAGWMRRTSITIAHLTPAMGQLVADAAGTTLPALRYAFFGADVLTRHDTDRLRSLAPAATCVNFYGASETPQAIAFYVVPDHADSPVSAEQTQRPAERVPLGQGIADVQLLVLNAERQLAGIGELGEIFVRTPYLSRGYLGQEQLTHERFVPNPFVASGERSAAQATADRLYRTGDLGRYRTDGLVEFAGRADDQVKIRGFRIEPGEIAAALRQHPAVREALVIAAGDHDQRRLVAYIVGEDPRTQNQEPTESSDKSPFSVLASPAELRSFVLARLPEYMLPAAFVVLPALPLTANGKLDRRALPLPEPDAQVRADDAYVAPRTPREELIAEIWAELLGVAQVGVQDNFFALGGHSLLATRLMARLQHALAIELPLRTLFAAPTVASLAQLIAERTGQRMPEHAAALPALVAAPEQRHAPFPLTDIQQAYWIGRRGVFELGDVATHSYIEIEAQTLDLARFEQTWQRLIQRHEMLRAIVLPDGRQQILAEVPLYQIAVLDLRDQPRETVQAALAAVRDEMSHQVLPSDQWPLFDIRASRLDDQRIRLHISTDALISDAWSRRILAREFSVLYAQPTTELPPLGVSFRDYVLAEEQLRTTELYRRALAYWRARLDARSESSAPTLPPAPELPLATTPDTLEQARFVRRSTQIEPPIWSQLKQRAARSGLTPSAVLLAAFAEVLTRWSKHSRFTINLTLFNRLPLHPQIDQIMGDFTSSSLLAVDNSTAGPFHSRARRLQDQLWDDLDQRYVSGVQVLRELARTQGSGLKAVMPVVFTSTLTQRSTDQDGADLAQLGQLVYSISQTPQVWLDHQVFEQGGALVFNWDAVEELFPAGLLQDMFDSYCRLLRDLAVDETSWQLDAPALLPTAQQSRRDAVNATDQPIPDGLLHRVVAQQAAARPEQIAVVAQDETLTYATVQRRATALAHRLRASGARPNMLVAVVMDKGWQQVVAVLGVLQAGAAYLPIDPGLPAERLHYLIEHGAVTLAVTQPWLAERLDWPDQLQRLVIAADDSEELPLLEPLQTPTDLAYVIYTSGSTGQPKGVMIDHRGALNTIADLNQRFAVGPTDRVLALSSLSFDLSVYDIFGTLAAGGTIVMPAPDAQRDPAQWAALLVREHVTLWNSVPALLEMLVEYAAERPEIVRGATGSGLRLIMLSGDWIPLPLPERIKALIPGVSVISLGGATEASIWSIYYPVEQIDPAWKSIPYGRPLLNQQMHVLSETLEPCPDWVPGELYISGIGLAQGYWRDEAKTSARFISHPRTGARLYRTGDLGRYLPDGTIEFLGREDFQVKIQGYRVELGEIEAALQQHPRVRTAVVAAVGEARAGGKRLVAYVVADEQAGATSQLPVDDRQQTADVPAGSGPAAEHGRLIDPAARLQFKLSQPGLRRDVDRPSVELHGDVGLPSAEYLRRRSYRAFLPQPIDLTDLSAWLSSLRQWLIDGAALPKYRYGSAGSLYPVQVYLHIKAGRVDQLAAGTYYYSPQAHRLIVLTPDAEIDRSVHAPANRTLFEDAAFSLFLVAQMRAVTPIYGDDSLRFALLEAGAISQLLEQAAPTHNLGLCQIGKLDFERIRALFALEEDHVFLHSLSGGAIDPAQTELPAFLRDTAHYEPLIAQIQAQPGSNVSAHAVAARAVDAVGVESALSDDLRSFLKHKVPEYMIPAAFVVLPALPLTGNGKVDRTALLALTSLQPEAAQSYVAPQTDVERSVAALLREVLGIERIGIHDNFFDLGGNSIHLVQVHSRLQRIFARDIPLVDMFTNPTISALTSYLSRAEPDPPPVDQNQEQRLKAGKDRLLQLRKRSST